MAVEVVHTLVCGLLLGELSVLALCVFVGVLTYSMLCEKG